MEQVGLNAVCLDDAKKFKSLKRHLMAKYALTPEQYRERWKLPAEYPMVAPNYARQRSELARVWARKEHGIDAHRSSSIWSQGDGPKFG
uniref:MucR family transcriptional regulator n=1 Tax=Rhizobium meliloti TaxID=382 RepID=I2E1B0_RHIML|nr:MucR family transcriptional regulator [Sinorhizobium meliloti]